MLREIPQWPPIGHHSTPCLEGGKGRGSQVGQQDPFC
jgi:hypothetical protein